MPVDDGGVLVDNVVLCEVDELVAELEDGTCTAVVGIEVIIPVASMEVRDAELDGHVMMLLVGNAVQEPSVRKQCAVPDAS